MVNLTKRFVAATLGLVLQTGDCIRSLRLPLVHSAAAGITYGQAQVEGFQVEGFEPSGCELLCILMCCLFCVCDLIKCTLFHGADQSF
eukprot:SAG31_NODE_270_length_18732_cov_9.342618_20_plen_88_part_00